MLTFYEQEPPLAYIEKKGVKVYYLDRFPSDTNVVLTLVVEVPDQAKKMNLAAYISGCCWQMIKRKNQFSGFQR